MRHFRLSFMCFHFNTLQISLATRIPRDAGTESTTELFDGLKEKIGEGIKGLQDVLTKENADVSGFFVIYSHLGTQTFRLIGTCFIPLRLHA